MKNNQGVKSGKTSSRRRNLDVNSKEGVERKQKHAHEV